MTNDQFYLTDIAERIDCELGSDFKNHPPQPLAETDKDCWAASPGKLLAPTYPFELIITTWQSYQTKLLQIFLIYRDSY